MQTLSKETPYEGLSPEAILRAVEGVTGQRGTGGLFALNSFENRVYDVAIDNGPNLIAKFYRPYRWSAATILEEHAFTAELSAAEIPVVGPLAFAGKTLFEAEGYLFALFPKRGGRPLDLRTEDDFLHMGRLVARVHTVGSRGRFQHRANLNVKTFGWDNLVYLRQSGMVPPHLMTAYDATVSQLLTRLDALWTGRSFTLRLHGDVHLGNVLVDREAFLVDLDDCLSGPAVQDLWMLASGDGPELSRQMGLLVQGYTQLRDFDYTELSLVEGLRTLRMINYTAWLARRWNDPTFPRNFPFFAGQDYWQRHILALKEQMAALDEPLLVKV